MALHVARPAAKRIDLVHVWQHRLRGTLLGQRRTRRRLWRNAKVLFMQELGGDGDILEERAVAGCGEAAVHHVLRPVVGDDVVRVPSHQHGHGLLDQPAVLEAIAVHQAPQQCAIPIQDREGGVGLGGRLRPQAPDGHPSCPLARRMSSGHAHILRQQLLPGHLDPPSLLCPLLPRLLPLARGKRPLQLPVDEEVAQDAGRRPGHAVSPSLDPGVDLVKDEDVARPDQVAALAVVRAARDLVDHVAVAGLKEQQRVVGRGDVAVEGGRQSGGCLAYPRGHLRKVPRGEKHCRDGARWCSGARVDGMGQTTITTRTLSPPVSQYLDSWWSVCTRTLSLLVRREA